MVKQISKLAEGATDADTVLQLAGASSASTGVADQMSDASVVSVLTIRQQYMAYCVFYSSHAAHHPKLSLTYHMHH